MVEKLPAVEEKISFLTAHGPEQARYTGALLRSVLDRAEMLGGDRRARLHRTIMVTGRDGYTAVLALAEIDPEFEGKQVLLAYRRDGQPIEDTHCAWWCRVTATADAASAMSCVSTSIDRIAIALLVYANTGLAHSKQRSASIASAGLRPKTGRGEALFRFLIKVRRQRALLQDAKIGFQVRRIDCADDGRVQIRIRDGKTEESPNQRYIGRWRRGQRSCADCRESGDRCAGTDRPSP